MQAIRSNQRSHVGRKLVESIDQTGLTARIRIADRLHRIGIDVDDRPEVVREDVVHDDRLGTANEYRRRGVAAAATAVARCWFRLALSRITLLAIRTSA